LVFLPLPNPCTSLCILLSTLRSSSSSFVESSPFRPLLYGVRTPFVLGQFVAELPFHFFFTPLPFPSCLEPFLSYSLIGVFTFKPVLTGLSLFPISFSFKNPPPTHTPEGPFFFSFFDPPPRCPSNRFFVSPFLSPLRTPSMRLRPLCPFPFFPSFFTTPCLPRYSFVRYHGRLFFGVFSLFPFSVPFLGSLFVYLDKPAPAFLHSFAVSRPESLGSCSRWLFPRFSPTVSP